MKLESCIEIKVRIKDSCEVDETLNKANVDAKGEKFFKEEFTKLIRDNLNDGSVEILEFSMENKEVED